MGARSAALMSRTASCGSYAATTANDEIGRVIDDGHHDTIKLLRVQGGIGVHHCDHRAVAANKPAWQAAPYPSCVA